MMRAMWNFYGAKWRSAPSYSLPRFDTIVEPFAGAAGYSCRYPSRQVVLCDLDPKIAGIWRFLIGSSADDILALPDIPPGARVSDLRVCQEAQWLIGFYVTAGGHSPCQTPSKWARLYAHRDQFWGPRARIRLASQVSCVKHWRIYECDYRECPVAGQATYFVDPPYQVAGVRYRYNSTRIDFAALGDWCRSLEGQVIVCENDGADWLPFRWHRAVPSCAWRGPQPDSYDGIARVSREVIWTNDFDAEQCVLL